MKKICSEKSAKDENDARKLNLYINDLEFAEGAGIIQDLFNENFVEKVFRCGRKDSQ